MVSKVFSGHSFYHACRYVVNKPQAEVLECEGVRGHDFKLMADDFIMQQQLRPQKEKACFHCSLSFHPNERVSDELMVTIAKEYLEKMKINNTQFAITKHSDRRHIHLHIVANMVDNKGQSITDSFLGLRGKKIAQQLTQQYQLIPAIGKNLALTNHSALHPSEANKYKVYEAVLKVLPQCKTLQDLEKKLQLRGIEMQYKYKGQTAEKQGVTFKIGADIFKGSKVDTQLSLGNLQKAIANTQGQLLEAKQNFGLNNQADAFKQAKGNHEVLAEGIKKTIDILFAPHQGYGQTPYELLHESRKRKKQLKNRH